MDINIYPPNSLTFLCLRNNGICVQSFARSNLVEGLDPEQDLLTFLQVIHIDIGVRATSIHTSWQELTSTLKAVIGEPPFSRAELSFHSKAGSQYRAEAVAAHWTMWWNWRRQRAKIEFNLL